MGIFVSENAKSFIQHFDRFGVAVSALLDLIVVRLQLHFVVAELFDGSPCRPAPLDVASLERRKVVFTSLARVP